MTVPEAHHVGNGAPKPQCRDAPLHANRTMRVVIIGAGASGIYMAHKLKYNFTDFVLNIYEKNADIGGTWFENRYPGCACDVPSHNYTYTFDPKCDWSSTYPPSREIFQYFSDFVDKHKLRGYIASHHEVTGARWDENASEWLVQVHNRETGSTFEQRCDFLINACGFLNSWRLPTIPGIQTFKGPLLHTAAWDDNVDLTGKRVGLIGNGSSAIQVLPQIPKVAKHVTTFIRKPTWVTPTFGVDMREYTDDERQKFRENPEEHLAMRKATEKVLTGVYPLFIKDWPMQAQTAEYMKAQMKEKINHEELADKLIPNFPVGCRRLTPGVNYLESLTLPNVTTLYGEITEITPTSCITSTGTETELDVLICATGFDTTFRPRFPLLGRTGQNLQDEWAHEPRNYLGVAASGFPNYFMLLGPNSPVGSGPSIISIEVQGSYIAEFLNRWQKEDIKTFDPKREAVNDFMEQKDLFMERTVWNSNCKTWYKDPVTDKITALWPGSVMHYIETMAKPRYDDYDVAYASRNRFAYLGNGFSQIEHRPDADTTYYIRDRDDGASMFPSLFHTVNAKDSRALAEKTMG